MTLDPSRGYALVQYEYKTELDGPPKRRIPVIMSGTAVYSTQDPKSDMAHDISFSRSYILPEGKKYEMRYRCVVERWSNDVISDDKFAPAYYGLGDLPAPGNLGMAYWIGSGVFAILLGLVFKYYQRQTSAIAK
jgi:hypothetical protein